MKLTVAKLKQIEALSKKAGPLAPGSGAGLDAYTNLLENYEQQVKRNVLKKIKKLQKECAGDKHDSKQEREFLKKFLELVEKEHSEIFTSVAEHRLLKELTNRATAGEDEAPKNPEKLIHKDIEENLKLLKDSLATALKTILAKGESLIGKDFDYNAERIWPHFT